MPDAATPTTPAEPHVVSRGEWRARYDRYYNASRQKGISHRNAEIWAHDCATNDLGPEPVEVVEDQPGGDQ